MSTCDNENKFKDRMNGHIKKKLSFKCGNKTYISVDGHFEYNNKLYLLEIDSGNEAKLLAGQYVLINALWKDICLNGKTYNIKQCVFLVVHYYKDYNPNRTINVLSKLKEEFKLSLEFKACHENQVASWNEFINLI